MSGFEFVKCLLVCFYNCSLCCGSVLQVLSECALMDTFQDCFICISFLLWPLTLILVQLWRYERIHDYIWHVIPFLCCLISKPSFHTLSNVFCRSIHTAWILPLSLSLSLHPTSPSLSLSINIFFVSSLLFYTFLLPLCLPLSTYITLSLCVAISLFSFEFVLFHFMSLSLSVSICLTVSISLSMSLFYVCLVSYSVFPPLSLIF